MVSMLSEAGSFVLHICIVSELMAVGSLTFGLPQGQNFCETKCVASVERVHPANLVITTGWGWGLASLRQCLVPEGHFGRSVLRCGTSTEQYLTPVGTVSALHFFLEQCWMVVVLTAGCGCHSQFVTCWRKPVGSPGCKALAGSGCGSAAWGLHGSFPTRWHQHFFSLTRKSLIRCNVAVPSPAFPLTPVAGDGAWDFQWAATLRAFFWPSFLCSKKR